MTPRNRALVFALFAFAAAPRAAHASSFDTFGFDVESASRAGATVAFGRSIGVVNQNPALLVDVPEELYAGLSFTAPALHIRGMAKPNGTDVPMSIYDSNLGSTPGLQDRALPTLELPVKRGDTSINSLESSLALGFASSFGVPKLRVAALAQLPFTGGDGSSATTHYDDEREANFSNRLSFTRFGQWDHVATAMVGAGYELTPRVTVGASFRIAATAVARFAIYVPDAGVQSYTQNTMNTHIGLAVRPVTGVRLRASKNTVFGFVWRDESYFQIDGASDVTLWNDHAPIPDRSVLHKASQVLPVVFGYVPMEVAGALGTRQGKLTAEVVGTWQRWSHYVDGHGVTPETGAAPPPSPFETRSVDTSRYAFHDTIALQAGASYQVSPAVEASVGAAYYPSPVPAQTGRTSFVDSAIVGVTTGQRYEFRAFEQRWIAAIGAGLWRMTTRTTHKDPALIVDEFPDASRQLQSNRPMPEATGLQTNNPGFPGYTSSGWLLSGGVSLSRLF
jgi:hypothetical protein